MKEKHVLSCIKNKSKILSIIGAVCLGSSALLLENEVLTGIFSILGFILLICGGRYACRRSDIILNAILLWLGHVLRFSGLFGTEFVYTLLCALSLIPYCAVLAAALFPDRLLQKAGHPFLATLIMPVTCSLCSFLLTILNFGYILNATSYIMCIPVIAVNLSLLGEYLLTFILMWILVCLPAILLEPAKKTKIAVSAVAFILAAALLISGVCLRSKWKEPDYTLKVALATSQESDFTGENGVVYTRNEQLNMFSSAIEQAYDYEAKLLILNEEYFMWREENVESMLDEVSQLVCSYGIPTLIGLEIVSEEGLNINEAVFFDADGKILYTYIKNNLVPFIEAGYYVDGEDESALIQTTIDGHTLDIAFVICYDINDEAYLKTIPSTTELLVVPSWDWDTENLEQKRTRVRSAALGLTLIKHSFDGFSYVSCPNGDCAEEVDFRGLYETVKTVEVPIWENK